MDYTVLEKSPLFAGIPAVELRELLETTPVQKVILRRSDGKVVFMLNTMFFSAFFVKYGK